MLQQLKSHYKHCSEIYVHTAYEYTFLLGHVGDFLLVPVDPQMI